MPFLTNKTLTAIIIIFFLALALAPNVLALDLNPFFNTKQYDANTKTVTIKNTFVGLPLGTVAEVRLLSNQIEYVIAGKDRKVAEFEIINYNDGYKSAIKQIDVFNLRAGNKKVSKSLTYKYAVEVNRTEISQEFECDKDNIKCWNNKNISVTYKTIEWKPFDSTKDLPSGKIRIGLFTDVNRGDYYEWIPTLFDVEVKEWAVWTDSLSVGLRSYYRLNETTGNRTDVLGLFNATVYAASPASTTGIISNAAISQGTGALNFSKVHQNAGNLTISFWLNDNNVAANHMIFGSGNSPVANGLNLIIAACPQTNAATLRFFAGGTTCAETSYVNVNNATWQHYVITVNGYTANATFYQNGIIKSSKAINGFTTTSLNKEFYTFFNANTGTDYAAANIAIDEMGIWTRILSDSEVSDLFNAGQGMTYLPPIPDLEYPVFSNFVENPTDPTTYALGKQFIFNTTIMKTNGTAGITMDGTNYSMTNYTGNFTVTLTSLSVGQHNYTFWAYGNGSLHLYNQSAQYDYTVLNETITQNAPSNNYASTVSTINFNCTVSNQNDLTAIYLYIGSALNYTKTIVGENRSELNTDLSFTDNMYNWSCGYRNVLNDFGISGNFTFTVDTVKPIVNITYPLNLSSFMDTTATTNITVNFTVSDNRLSSCWFGYGNINYSLTCGDNASIMASAGNSTIYFYANDTVGNINSITSKLFYNYLNVSVSYPSLVVEGDVYSFNLSILPIALTGLNGTFVYNGTPYNPTVTINSTTGLLTNTIQIANVTVDGASKNFYWFFNATIPTLTKNFSTSVYTQQGNIFNASDTNDPYTVPFVNFIVYDEETLTPLDSVMQLSFDYFISGYRKTLSRNYSTPRNNFNYSIYPYYRNYTINGTLYFYASGYNPNLYNLKETLLTNMSQNISLYLINSSRTTSFIIKVQDSTLSAVPHAIVEIERYYPSTNSFAVVQSLETNIDGKTTANFVTETVKYRFKVYLDESLTLTTSPTKIFCEATPCTVTITLPESATNGASFFSQPSGLTQTLVYSKTTQTVTYSYSDTASTAQGGKLYVVKHNFVGADTVVCNTLNTNASGIISCNLIGMPNGSYIASAYNNRVDDMNHLVNRIIFTKTVDASDRLGSNGGIWSIFILIALATIGLVSPIVAITFVLFGIVVLSLLGLMTIPAMALGGIIIIGLLILWEMNR